MKVLITGAVEGLGRSLADLVISRGHDVLAVDHNRHGLYEMTQSNIGMCESRVLDLADLETVRLFGEKPPDGPFDLVILNAGISATGKFEEIPADAYDRLIKVNLRAPLILASALVREGHIKRGGKIVFISSLSHATGYPGAAVYAATKDGIAVYARSVRKAFKKKKVKLLTVFPGPIDTKHAAKHAPKDSDASKRMDPDKLARIIMRTTRYGREELYPGLPAQLAATAGRFAPKMLTKAMRRNLYDKMDRPNY